MEAIESEKTDFLNQKARYLRAETLELIVSSKKGHIGGALSTAEILVALFYGGVLNFDPKKPDWEERDRFLISKGHGAFLFYCMLADLGYITKDQLYSIGKNGAILGNHPDAHVPGVEFDSGSLGHGVGVGSGIALASKLANRNFITYVLIGDGESYEGSIWEAAMFAAHRELSNLVVITDRNFQCATDFTEDCNRLEPLDAKWKAFGWDTYRIDGHSVDKLVNLLNKIKQNKDRRRPVAIIADTVKGKGVSFMEKTVKWHHGLPAGSELDQARRELSQ